MTEVLVNPPPAGRAARSGNPCDSRAIGRVAGIVHLAWRAGSS